jgi:hypothetical protein
MLPSGSGGTTAAGAGGASGTASIGGSGGNGFGNPEQMTGGSAGTAGTLASGGVGGPSDTCAQGMATATPVTPNVWLVLDGSSSMREPFGATGTRWQTLRSTLMDPGGIVDSLQSVVRFGMVIYSGADAFAGGAECTKLVTVEPALDNYATLMAQYPADPIGTGTPTHKAIEHVVDNLPVLNEQVLDMNIDPTFVVLATDGAPNDSCGGGGFGVGAEPMVLDIVTRGTTQGMNMFVISLAGGDMALQSHLNDVAAATRTMTPPFVPETRDSLVETFRMIVGSATCRVELDGTVAAGKECQGEVRLSGAPQACNDPNGWQLENERTVQLNGAACETFLSTESMVVAQFPCELFTPD